jgi:hypothetical protein
VLVENGPQRVRGILSRANAQEGSRESFLMLLFTGGVGVRAHPNEIAE